MDPTFIDGVDGARELPDSMKLTYVTECASSPGYKKNQADCSIDYLLQDGLTRSARSVKPSAGKFWLWALAKC